MEEKNEHQQTDKMILEYPYRPFGVLQVTATRLIFRKYWPGINTFSGVIDISDLREVRLIKGGCFLEGPTMEIEYVLPSGKLRKIAIYLEGYAVRMGMELRSGTTPEKVFATIESLRKGVRL